MLCSISAGIAALAGTVQNMPRQHHAMPGSTLAQNLYLVTQEQYRSIA
jgi:hypothetical protein